MTTEMMTMEDLVVTEVRLIEARQGEIMEIARMNVPIADQLIIKTPMIVDLGQKTERILEELTKLVGNLSRQVSHSHRLKNYPKQRKTIVLYTKISLLKRRRIEKADQNLMLQMLQMQVSLQWIQNVLVEKKVHQ